MGVEGTELLGQAAPWLMGQGREKASDFALVYFRAIIPLALGFGTRDVSSPWDTPTPIAVTPIVVTPVVVTPIVTPIVVTPVVTPVVIHTPACMVYW